MPCAPQGVKGLDDDDDEKLDNMGGWVYQPTITVVAAFQTKVAHLCITSSTFSRMQSVTVAKTADGFCREKHNLLNEGG
jgi:hypothetical protein